MRRRGVDHHGDGYDYGSGGSGGSAEYEADRYDDDDDDDYYDDYDDDDDAGHDDYGDIDQLLGDETTPIRREDGYRARQRVRRDVDRRRRRAGPKLVVVLVVVAVLLGGGIYGIGKVVGRVGGGESTKDYAGPGSGEAVVQIAQGATIRDIAHVLAAADVVASEGAFVAAAAANPEALGIQPGYYRLKAQMTSAGALEALLDPGANSLYRFTISEGSTVQQILAALSERTGVAVSEYQKVIDNPAELGLPSWAPTVNGVPNAEGYLFPSTYDLVPGATPAATLKMFVDQFRTETAGLDLENAAAAGNMSPAEVVIIASIIEKEVANHDEGPRVARVIYNRLNDTTGRFTRIDMDSTTRYAFDLPPDQPLTTELLNTRDPYNTRAVAGLPPGAISNPGRWALESALHPAAGSWLWFVSLPRSGETIFCSTEQEWAAANVRYRAEGGG